MIHAKAPESDADFGAYVFVLTGQESGPHSTSGKAHCTLDGCLYGICAIVDEIVPLNLDAPRPRHRRSSPDRFFAVPHCYCLVTEHPFFDLHFAVLRSILQLQRLKRIENHASAAVEWGNVETILSAYYSTPMPQPGDSLMIHPFEWLPPVRWECKSDERAIQLAKYGLQHLFAALPTDQILFLLGCAMLELKIVFVSSNAGQLSASILALLSLLSPLLWPHPLIPLMPEALHTYCDAPFPVIVGVQTMPPNVADALRYESAKGGCGDNPASELVAVLLDEGRVRLSDSLSMSYHKLKLPGIDQLYHELEPLRESIVQGDVGEVLEKIRTHILTLTEACHRVKDFVKPQTRRRSGVVPSCIVDARRPEVSASAASFGTSAWPFMRTLLATQSFAQWAEVRSREKSAKRKMMLVRTAAPARRAKSRIPCK